MKSFLRAIVAGLMGALARAILRKYRPAIVMVTGSVGKTSTKDAIAAALSPRFYLRKSEKSYNSEFGLPLTVIGAKNPWSNPLAWLRVVGEALALIILPNHYPKLLVLEVGADRPGDLARILRIATPDVVVVTRLPEIPVHVEAYASPDAVRMEEFQPAYALAPGAPLIVSADDRYALEMAKPLSVRCITYGFEKDAQVHMSNPVFAANDDSHGMEAKVTIGKEHYEIAAAGAIGKQQLYAPAAALAAALALSMDLKDAALGLRAYQPPPGRSRVLKGLQHSLLIDDTYNASPAAVEEALTALMLVKHAKRRIVVLGDMLELGRFSVAEHERIGVLAASVADIVVAVGSRAEAIYRAARDSGMPEAHAVHFATSALAVEHVKSVLSEGDTVLIKGSQSIRMERITEALLEDARDTSELVRQDKEWRKR